MILLTVIVQVEDVAKLTERLLECGFRLTRINSTGAFLAVDSAVLLIGVEEERLAEISEIVGATCRSRTRLENAAPWPGMAGMPIMGAVMPMEVTVGGAVMFGLPVENFIQLAGNEAAESPESVSLPAGSKPGTKLVVAIVQNEDSDAVVNALMDAGYRLTRINTAGGFLRRGNATLLIGVEVQRLNDVLSLIQTNCRRRSEPAPVQQGMPMYAATVFVLDASHFLRF